MSCPRPHGKSLMQLGSRQRCHGSRLRVWYFSAVAKRKDLNVQKACDNIRSLQMGSGCHLTSESFGEEVTSLNGKQRDHNVVYLVFAAIDQGVDFLYLIGCSLP